MWGRPSPTSSISPCLATQPLRRKRCALLLQLNKKQVTSTSMEGQQKWKLADALWLVEVESSATNASASTPSDSESWYETGRIEFMCGDVLLCFFHDRQCHHIECMSAEYSKLSKLNTSPVIPRFRAKWDTTAHSKAAEDVMTMFDAKEAEKNMSAKEELHKHHKVALGRQSILSLARWTIDNICLNSIVVLWQSGRWCGADRRRHHQ